MERISGFVLFWICMLNIHPGVQAIGINYGLKGNNLPPPSDVIAVLKQRGVPKIRVFEPDQGVLTALQNSGISVIVGTLNEDLQSLASDPSKAVAWVNTNIVPHCSSVQIICVVAGNEVVPGEFAQYVPGAMRNLDTALTAANMPIPISTVVSMKGLSVSYPPSKGAFSAEASPVMTELVTFLASKKSPFLVNVYPYFAYVGDPLNVDLAYALFQENATQFYDGSLTYHSLFDAMVDAVHSALEKVGGQDLEVVVTETGWPSDGDSAASLENQKTYVNNLIKHVSSGQGTPKKPGKDIDTYIFALFNENLKSEGVEQHWGMYYPNLTEVYHADL